MPERIPGIDIEQLKIFIENRIWILLMIFFIKDFVKSLLLYLYLSQSNIFSRGASYDIEGEELELENFGMFRLVFKNAKKQTVFIPVSKMFKITIKSNGSKKI